MSATSLGAAGWLRLAAAPTFALMAVLTMLTETGPGSPMCGQAAGPWLLAGMTPMYLLMALFHLPPWFKLAAPPDA